MICQRPGLIDYAIVNSALLRPMPTALKLIEPSVRISFPLTRYRWFSRWQASTLYVNEVDFEQYYAETLHMKGDAGFSAEGEYVLFNLRGFKNPQRSYWLRLGRRREAVLKVG